MLFDDGDREATVQPRYLRPRGAAAIAATATTTNSAGAPPSMQPSTTASASASALAFAVGSMVDCQFEGALGGVDWFVRARARACVCACVDAKRAFACTAQIDWLVGWLVGRLVRWFVG